MQQLSKLLGRVLSVITALVIIVMMLHVVINALSRFFFSTPIYGTNEIAGFWYLPIIALLGIPVAQLQREHIVVALLLDRMSARAAGWCMLLASLATAAVCAGFAWFGLHRAVEQMIDWEPERVIFAHGRWYQCGGATELRRAFRWLID